MLQNSFRTSIPKINTSKHSAQTVLICLIPGNPGLIEYYRHFLNHLARTLESQKGHVQFEIYGHSLSGFELSTHNYASPKQPPYSLEEQISLVHQQLNATVSETCRDIDGKAAAKLPVILIGHSVGAYILLEILAQRQRLQRAENVARDDLLYEVVGGICLFPTVVDIAKSPSGKIAAPLLLIPGLPLLIHYLAKLLCSLLSTSSLSTLIKRITKMPDAAAATTTAFLQSPHGVYQALCMAHHELREIARDKWDEHIWGGSDRLRSTTKHDADSGATLAATHAYATDTATDASLDKPHLDFYWAEHDHWVDNRTRDGLIARRARRVTKVAAAAASTAHPSANEDANDDTYDDEDGGEAAKPRMEIDTRGIPHAFCLRHSEPVAEKVAEYIEELVRSRWGLRSE